VRGQCALLIALVDLDEVAVPNRGDELLPVGLLLLSGVGLVEVEIGKHESDGVGVGGRYEALNLRGVERELGEHHADPHAPCEGSPLRPLGHQTPHCALEHRKVPLREVHVSSQVHRLLVVHHRELAGQVPNGPPLSAVELQLREVISVDAVGQLVRQVLGVADSGVEAESPTRREGVGGVTRQENSWMASLRVLLLV